MNRELRERIQRWKIRLQLVAIASPAYLSRKRSLYLDCGSNLGQGYSFFSTYLRPARYDAILIEPNPNCVKKLRATFETQKLPHLEIIEAAAWIEETTLKLFGLVEDSRGAVSDGASVIEKHNSTLYTADPTRATEVRAISLARLIEQKAKVYNHIIVKMDIESAEYKVLENLLETNAVKHIRHLFVEFHSKFFTGENKVEYEELQKNLIERLKQKGVATTTWF